MRKKQIKRLTYRNLLIVIHKIEAKGYDFKEAETIARRIFEDFQIQPLGLSIEERIGMILNKAEFEAQYQLEK